VDSQPDNQAILVSYGIVANDISVTIYDYTKKEVCIKATILLTVCAICVGNAKWSPQHLIMIVA